MNGSQIVIGRALQNGSYIVVPNHKNVPVAVWPYGTGDCPHALIVGTTGAGKTTLVRWMVIDLIWSPQAKKITLIDGKGADSFLMFTGQPGIAGIANKPDPTSGKKDPIPDIIRLYHKEIQRRYDEFTEAKRQALWTGRRIDYTPPVPLWLIFDEFLDWILGLPGKLQREMHKLLIFIGQKGREANCHLVIATQAPYAETISETGLPGLLKRQLKCRIAVVGNHGLDDIEAKMAFGAGHANAGDIIASAAIKAGLKGKQRRGVGMIRVGSWQATFKCPWVADPLHWDCSEKDRIAALRMLPRKLHLVKNTNDTEEETA